MATIVNNPPANSDGGNNSGMLLGIILLIVVVVLFFYFGLPFIRGGSSAPASSGQSSAPTVNVNTPSK